MTSVFKIRKNSRILHTPKKIKFVEYVQIRFIVSLVTAKFSNSHNTSTASITLRQPLNGTAAVDNSDSDTGKTVKLQAIRRLCNRLNG